MRYLYILLIFCGLAYSSSLWALSAEPSVKQALSRQDLFDKAMNLYLKKKFKAAEDILHKLVITRPIHRKSHELLAILSGKMGHYVRALKLTYRLIETYHGDSLLRKKSAQELTNYLKASPDLVRPSNTVLNYYFNMAQFHILQVNKRYHEMRPKDSFLLQKRHSLDEDYMIEQHISLAEKHFAVCSFFEYKHAQFENGLAHLERLKEKVHSREEDPLIETGGKEKITQEFKSFGDIENKTFFVDFFTSLMFWRENVNLVSTSGQKFPLQAQSIGPCAGVGISKRMNEFDWNASGCFFLTRAYVSDQPGGQITYFDPDTRMRGSILGFGGLWRPGERYGVGVFLAYLYRQAFFHSPDPLFSFDRDDWHTGLIFLETRYEWKQIFVSNKIGLGYQLPSVFWSFNVHYRL